MSTYSFDPSNQSSVSTPATSTSCSNTPPSVQIPNPEYFAPAINNMATTGQQAHAALFKNMRTNSTFQPPPLSPHTALQIIEGPYDISFILVTNIAKGLAATVDQHDQMHSAEKQCLKECLRGMGDKIEHYKAMFNYPPDGYIENNNQYPSLTIPIGNRLFRSAKWIKQLNSRRVAMLSTQDRPNTKPIITEIYTTPIYGNSPINPMPYWFCDLLIRPSPLFLTLYDTIANLNN